jgi:site-specific recombinase XerC
VSTRPLRRRRGRPGKSGLPPRAWRAPSRHGNGKGNWYYRRGDGTYIPLRGELFSPEWWADYNAAANGEPAPDRSDRGASRLKSGSFGAVISGYKQTAAYKSGATGTIRGRNTQLNYIVDTLKLPDVPVASMRLVQLEAIIENRAAQSVAMARQLLIVFRALFERAVRMELVEANPAKSIKEPKPAEAIDGYLDWPEEVIEQYKRQHPFGTMARVALEVFLNNGPRIGDACRIGWWTVKDGWITDFKTEKTGKVINIKIGPDLQAALDAMGGLPSVGPERVAWIRGPRGSMVSRSLRRVFREWCNEAGIPAIYHPHGIRHSVARRLMDAEVPIEDAMTVTGHSDRRVFLHYAKKRDERKANERASAKYAAAYGGANV